MGIRLDASKKWNAEWGKNPGKWENKKWEQKIEWVNPVGVGGGGGGTLGIFGGGGAAGTPGPLAKTKPYTTIPSLDKIFNQLISFPKNDTLF